MTIRSIAERWQRDESLHFRLLKGLAAGLALVYVVGVLWTSASRTSLVRGDARAYFAYLPSLVLDQDIDLRNQFAVLRPEGVTDYPFGVGRHNLAQNPFPIAPAILWLPGYLFGLGIDAVLYDARSPGRPIGYGVGASLGAAVWSILLVGLGAELTRRLARQLVDAPAAFAATIMAWLGTPALYYTVISPLYSHAPAWVAVSFMLWLTWRATQDPDRVRPWLWSGLAAGWVVAVRLQDASLLVVPVALLTMTLLTSNSMSRLLGCSVAWVVGAAVGYLVQGLTWYWLHGEWVPFGGASAMSKPTLTDLVGILFSFGHRGWISWTPIVLAGLVGLGLLALRGDRAATRQFGWAAIAGVVGILLMDLAHPFGGGAAGAAFGGRRYVSATPLVALGLAALLGPQAGPRARSLSWILVPALTIWNLGLLLSYELLVIRHGIYPTLLQTVRYALGLGVS